MMQTVFLNWNKNKIDKLRSCVMEMITLLTIMITHHKSVISCTHERRAHNGTEPTDYQHHVKEYSRSLQLTSDPGVWLMCCVRLKWAGVYVSQLWSLLPQSVVTRRTVLIRLSGRHTSPRMRWHWARLHTGSNKSVQEELKPCFQSLWRGCWRKLWLLQEERVVDGV